MKRNKIVAGNWKMNLTLDQSTDLIKKLKDISSNHTEIKIAPSFTNLHNAVSLLVNSNIEVIAQDVYFENRGAFTGEVSTEMLQSIGVKSVIIGHSERRKYFNESNQIIRKKVQSAISNSFNVIFCIGEEINERTNGNHFNIIENQVVQGLFHLESDDMNKIAIAYEPVWAIGTGKTANSIQIQEMHEFIRGLVNDNFGENISKNIRILYGGSVNPKNANEIFSLNDVDGGLIGGASLNFSDFNSIVKAANG